MGGNVSWMRGRIDQMDDDGLGDLQERAIANLERAYIKLAPSRVGGIGAFAVVAIARSTIIFKWDWSRWPCIVVPLATLQQRVPSQTLDQLRRIWPIVDNGRALSCPLDFSGTITYVNYLNHSSDPNVAYLPAEGAYVAINDVAECEELTIDYRDYAPGNIDWDER
ncbi:unnamed protein product [Phaeothamnion confervicola]